MYGYQGPPFWLPQGFQQLPPNVPMMQPITDDPQVFHPAEMADTSKQNDAADVEEVPVSPAPGPTGKGRSKKVVTRIKLSNFHLDEDVNIVKSWLESCDPITSTPYKKDRMWDRILQRYNSRRGSYPERSLRSLQSRWDRIKAEVGKFSSFYADTIRENPSGMSDADKTTHAAANFAGIHKYNFAFLHCWEIMKDEPKWKEPKPKACAKSAGGEGFGEDNNHVPDTNNLGEHNCSPIGSAGKRPMGRVLAHTPPTTIRKEREKRRKDSAADYALHRDSAKASKKKANSAGGEGFAEDNSHGPNTNDLGEHNCSPIGSAGKRPGSRDSAKASKKKANSSAGSGFGEDNSHGPDTNDLGERNCSPIGSAGKRPMGRDSAKASKKKANSSADSTSSSEHASRMQDLLLQKNSIPQEAVCKNDRFQQLACIDEKRFGFEEMRRHNQSLLDIEQEKIRMMREKHDMDRQEKEKREDERILGIDLNACTPAQRLYYEALQEEILEKIAARHAKRLRP